MQRRAATLTAARASLPSQTFTLSLCLALLCAALIQNCRPRRGRELVGESADPEPRRRTQYRLHKESSAYRRRLGDSSGRRTVILVPGSLGTTHAPWPLDGTRQGAGLLVWVVDDAAQLSTLLKLGVRRVISNTPLELKRAVQRMCDNAPGRG